MIWSYDSLWQKSKVYITRALEADRDGPLFPFWATLALEFLGRATLAKVHPVLLADPREGENIMYAVGYGTTAIPKSIAAKTVFTRCKTIVANFTDKEFKTCMAMMDRRNEELHSGAPSFEDYPTNLWMADFYRIAKMLLEFQELTLEDFLGVEDAEVAHKMIEATQTDAQGKVLQLIATARRDFELITSVERAQRQTRLSGLRARFHESKAVNCPACSAKALIHGERVKAYEPRLEEDEIVQEFVVLPTHFVCPLCELELDGHTQLHVAGLGGQYTVRESAEPSEFYGAQWREHNYEDDIDFDYGND